MLGMGHQTHHVAALIGDARDAAAPLPTLSAPGTCPCGRTERATCGRGETNELRRTADVSQDSVW